MQPWRLTDRCGLVLFRALPRPVSQGFGEHGLALWHLLRERQRNEGPSSNFGLYVPPSAERWNGRRQRILAIRGFCVRQLRGYRTRGFLRPGLSRADPLSSLLSRWPAVLLSEKF